MHELKAAQVVLDVLVDQSTRAEKALSDVLRSLERTDPSMAMAVASQLRALKNCAEEMTRLIAHLRKTS
jgi:hypothetical protein